LKSHVLAASNPVLSKEPRLGILPLPHCAECLATGPRGRRGRRGCGRWRLAGAGHDLEGQGGNQRHSPEDVEDDGVLQVPEAPRETQWLGSLLANSQLLQKKQQRCPDVPIKLAGSCMDAYTPQRVANHPKFQGQIGVAGLCFLGAQTVQVEDNGWDANDTSCGG